MSTQPPTDNRPIDPFGVLTSLIATALAAVVLLAQGEIVPGILAATTVIFGLALAVCAYRSGQIAPLTWRGLFSRRRTPDR